MMSFDQDLYRRLVREALGRLGVDRLVLSIHDPSFPSLPEDETGRGSPYGGGGQAFVRFVAGLGFDGLQLGPQGQTSRVNKSPYDGTLFSKNVLSIALRPLTGGGGPWPEILPEETLAEIVAERPRGGSPDAAYAYAYDAQWRALRQAYVGFALEYEHLPELVGAIGGFCEREAGWLERDALYWALAAEYGHDDWLRWGTDADDLERRLFAPRAGEEQRAAELREEIARHQAGEMGFYCFCQFVVHEQHRELQALARSLGVQLFGDLQIGFSHQDLWGYQGLFLDGYRMGAPPSRTNPEGQPWGYPVFDPRLYVAGPEGRLGPVLDFLTRRIDKMLAEFDGVRIDHPHGLVDPWVYRSDLATGGAESLRAVQAGARLFSSPALADHPALAALAIARPDQLNPAPGTPRYADDWVVALEPEQVRRYGTLLDLIVERSRARGRGSEAILCEVLSTWPYPLRRVMETHGLGRFCVTQKARLDDPADVYRSENARPADWIMVGNHDTRSIWQLIESWQGGGGLAARAAYLAERLEPEVARRSAFAAELASDPLRLAEALFADALASPARQVSVFFTDLLGLRETYNQPGVVDEANWSLRVPSDYERFYRAQLASRRALNVPGALALALRSRAGAAGEAGAMRELATALEQMAGAMVRPEG
ncbi:MAG TPA: 4-alpha-glucanotransferase [Polyangia bacterium]|nr:4-alpha-glucanotransferase [Polyangia bacterium]